MYVVACTGTSSLMCLAILVSSGFLHMLSHTQSPVLMYLSSQATVSYDTAQFQLDICIRTFQVVKLQVANHVKVVTLDIECHRFNC